MSESSYYECCGSFGTHTAECNRRVRSAALISPETPRDLLDECVPRVLELLRAAGITEPDELKHRLDDHERWRKELAAVSPQEDAAPPTLDRMRELARPSVEAMMGLLERGGICEIHEPFYRKQTTEMLASYGEMLFKNYPRQVAPSLLAVPEGRKEVK